jgi:hypothetical protein
VPPPTPPSVSIPLTKGRRTKERLATVVAPLEDGILDLRKRLEHTKGLKALAATVVAYIRQYWKFFVVLLAIIVFVMLVVWFVKGANAPEREFEVIIKGENQNIKMSSSDSAPAKLTPVPSAIEQDFTLSIINRSGDGALTDKVTTALAKDGFTVAAATRGDGVPEERTVIVYDPKEAEAALRLSKLLDNALLSSFAEPTATTSQIVIYLGTETIAKIK